MEPIDFEEYLIKHKVLLNNDPVREMLLVPPDPVLVSAFLTLISYAICIHTLMSLFLIIRMLLLILAENKNEVTGKIYKTSKLMAYL